MDLRDVVLELAEELESRTSAAASKAYETELARDALDKMIELIVDAAMEISRRYAHSKPGEFPTVITPINEADKSQVS